jgi:hypothetical protein
MDLHMRKALKEAMWKRYRKAPKKVKTKILDELCTLTGYHRQYAISQLNQMEDAEPPLQKQPRTRKRDYTQDVCQRVFKIHPFRALKNHPSSYVSFVRPRALG